MAQTVMTITKTKDVNLAALQAMLEKGSGQFLVTVHNKQIVSVSLVGRSQSVADLLAGATVLEFPGRDDGSRKGGLQKDE